MINIAKIDRVNYKEWNCQKLSDVFENLQIIGEGSYGVVYKAQRISDKQEFALKNLNISKETEGFPVSGLREIKTLQKLNHKNIIKLQCIVYNNDADIFSTYLVLEYMQHDLKGLIKQVHFQPSEIKCIMQQLLSGVAYLHSKQIIHRDIKSDNVLYNTKGEIKLADFGLAKKENLRTTHTNRVVTLWYRAPELLLGETRYDNKIDIWSIGCLFVELLLGDPLFMANTEEQLLLKIYKNLGNTLQEWPEVFMQQIKQQNLPKYYEFEPKFLQIDPKKEYINQLRQQIRRQKQNVDINALDLILNMLQMNPNKRISAQDALQHKYFTSVPLPATNMLRVDKECRVKDLIIKEQCKKQIIEQQKPSKKKRNFKQYNPFQQQQNKTQQININVQIDIKNQFTIQKNCQQIISDIYVQKLNQDQTEKKIKLDFQQ